MNCEKLISAGFSFDCAAELNGGINEILLLNKAEIKTAVKTGNQVVITMATGKKGYVVEVYKQGAQSTVAIKENEVAPNRSTHVVNFTAYGRDAATEETIQQVLNGRFVAVIKSKTTGVYEVYGLDSGLVCTGNDADSNANAGLTKLTLSTPDDTLGDTRYFLANDAAYEALKVVAS